GARRGLHSFPTRRSSDLQDEMGGLVERVVVAVPEGETGSTEAARPVADEIDDRGEFGSHGRQSRRRRESISGQAPASTGLRARRDRKSTRLNSSHVKISY